MAAPPAQPAEPRRLPYPDVEMKDITDQFLVRDDDGNEYQVLVYQKRIDTSTLDRRSFRHGLREARLADGRHLNRIDDNTFEIVEDGIRVTRVDT
ncbi:MAG: hypothetical protein AB1762_21515 [Gemmatimonadota bacterium]